MTPSAIDTTPALRAMASVSLEELDETAALQRRRDSKYVVGLDDAEPLLRSLATDGRRRVLEIDGQRSFRYESWYFDTVDLELYRAAVQRRRDRAKVRLRRYVESGDTFLEVKLKDRRGLQQKHRMSIEQLTTRLDIEMRQFVDHVTGTVGLGRRLEPTAVTRYRRSTLLHDSTATRATFDTDLTCFDVRRRRTGPVAPAVALPAMIIESKSGSGAAELDRLLWNHGIRPLRISKYCTGLAALDPDLPSNRWHRTLRDHFHTV